MSYELVTVNYSGHTFADFYVSRTHSDPGWFVFGRNSEKYGTRSDCKGAYTMLCARPIVKPRRNSHYNGTVRMGWKTRAEAQAVADKLNAI